MEVGMQIAYRGFAGSAAIEAAAAGELARMQRFAGRLTGCHVVVELMRSASRADRFDARLDLITHAHELIPMPHSVDEDARAALHVAFDAAVREMENSHGQG